MRVCVYGAGAIGGHLAARLVSAGASEVAVVARGAHLDAIREGGIRLLTSEGEVGGRPAHATGDPSTLPPQDVVFVTLKATSTPAHAESLAALLAPDGVAVFIANGIPWWWRHGLPEEGPLLAVDPQAALWSRFGAARAIGGVVYSGNEVVRPGVVRHREANRWPVGEPDGAMTPRLERVVGLMAPAGLAATGVPDIRRHVLRKLMRNVAGNPLSALTRLVDGPNAQVEGLAEVGRALIREALEVGAAQGIDLRDETDPAALVKPGERATGPSSTLQDVLAGRPLEVEPLLGGLQQLGRETGVATPTIDVVAALLRGLDLSIRERLATT